MSDTIVVLQDTTTIVTEGESPTVVVEGNSVESIVTETSTPIIVSGSSIEAILSKEVYNVVVEVESPTVIVAGQPGPQGPTGLSEDSVAYSRQTDFVGEDVIYKGEAEPGSSLSSPVWRIRKITILNDDISEVWADGNSNFDNVWSDRLTLNYSG